MRNTILFLAFVSGVCGIAYEVLYTRLLSTYFGNIFYVSAAILISFLLSIGIGSLVGHRFIRYIGPIEILIGLYGIFAVYFFKNHALELLSHFTVESSMFPFVFTGVVISFLIIPAFLIGFSIPIFSLYLKDRKLEESAFPYVYALYNFGAALSVIIIEYILIRNFGLSISILSIAFINVVNGCLLLWVVPVTKKINLTSDVGTFFTKKMVALFLISVASGIFQLFLLKLTSSIFGPFNENFSIVLFVVLMGMAVASLLVRKVIISYKKYLLFGLLAILVTFLSLTPFIYTWAFTQEHLGILYGLSWILKPFAIFIFSFLVLIFFGGTIPFLLQHNQNEADSIGKTLAVASFGNVTGFLLMTFVLYEKIPDSLVPFIISLFVLISFVIVDEIKIKEYYVILVTITLSLLIFMLWPYKLLNAGYRSLYSLQQLQNINNNLLSWEDYKKYNGSVSVLRFKDGSKWLSINGNINLRFGVDKKTQLREMVVGLSTAVYSKNHENALVLGLGSGVTAGTMAKIYHTTKIVEINPAMLKGVSAFSEENMDILNNPSSTIIIQDGIVELLNTKQKYDAIVNTVTGPKSFSSSKLWTKEVFDSISTKLNDGGIYSMWLDVGTGEEGLQVLIKTADSSFKECLYIFLNSGYLNVVCSNQLIIKRDIPNTFWSEDIIKRFEIHSTSTTISNFIHDLTLKIDSSKMYSAKTKLNTLDVPILEFTHLAEGKAAVKISQFMREIIMESALINPFTAKPITTKELKQRCNSFLIISNISC